MNTLFKQALRCVVENPATAHRQRYSIELFGFILASYSDLFRLLARLGDRVDPGALDIFFDSLAADLESDHIGINRVLSDVNEERVARNIADIGRILAKYTISMPVGELTEDLIFEIDETLKWAQRGALLANLRFEAQDIGLTSLVSEFERPPHQHKSESEGAA